MLIDLKNIKLEDAGKQNDKLNLLSFEQLQKEIDEVLEKLSSNNYKLNEASILYVYGKSITDVMKKKLDEISKSVNDK